MRKLFRPLLILLALVFLVEAWLWEHLAPIVALDRGADSLRGVQGQARGRDRAPAALSRRLLVFLVPVVLLLPLKFLGAVDAGA